MSKEKDNGIQIPKLATPESIANLQAVIETLRSESLVFLKTSDVTYKNLRKALAIVSKTLTALRYNS